MQLVGTSSCRAQPTFVIPRRVADHRWTMWWPTGRVLRGDSPHRLTPKDVADPGLWWVSNGARPAQRCRGGTAAGDAAAPWSGNRAHPVAPAGQGPSNQLGGIAEISYLPLAELYESFVDANLDYLATAFRVIVAPERHGVLFHCYAGKDRTGITAAVLLDVLGCVRGRHRGRLRGHRRPSPAIL